MVQCPIRIRKTPIAELSCVAMLVFAGGAHAQAPSGSAPQSGIPEQIPVKVFAVDEVKPPRLKRLGLEACDEMGQSRTKSAAHPECAAAEAQIDGYSGWVELAFMVDSSGHPAAVTVMQSTGNKIFEETATQAVEQSIFEPATLNGKPIESDSAIKYAFLTGGPSGASPDFVNAYGSLRNAISAEDRGAADAATKKLVITNVYEDAYFGVATYSYASKWGTEAERLAGLRRAIASESRARYLPVAMFKEVLLACLQLELQTHQYAEATATWKSLENLGVDDKTAVIVRPIMARLEKVRSDDSEYDVSDQIAKDSWHLHLFKRHFRAAVSAGQISDVKLRCDKGYVRFAFDPTLQYEIPSTDGDCWMELDGAPRTQFKLTQF